MSAGKNANGAKLKRDQTRPGGKANGKSVNTDVMRAGTVVETRGAGRSKRKPAKSTTKEPTRAGTVVETRGVASGRRGDQAAARERMRDGT
jgi:hypothetical protein